MKKILVRAGLSPLDNHSADYVLEHPKVLGTNAGNMIYAYGVWRVLTTEGAVLEPTRYQYRFTDAQIDEINQTCSAFVIPLANAFRESFRYEMNALTRVIRKLKIPVYVIGVGVDYYVRDPDLKKPMPFDGDVKRFVSAVLDHSAIIGTRGEMTVRYLERLGFREGKHMTAIGCPSLYAFGNELKIRKPGEIRRAAFNSSTRTTDEVIDFMARSVDDYPDSIMVWQSIKEYYMVYAGASYMYHDRPGYPCKVASDPLYLQDRIRMFVNVPSWMEFLAGMDLVYGSRLHGNIIGILSGTPSLLIPKDSRMQELAEYHHLAQILPDEITPDSTIRDFAGKKDLLQPVKYHKQNFDHYVDFLDQNGIDHIFRDGRMPARGDAPLDRQMAQVRYAPGVHTLFGVSDEEKAHRLDLYGRIQWDQKARAEKQEKRHPVLSRLMRKL